MERTLQAERSERLKSIQMGIKREIPTLVMSGAGFFIGRAALFQFINPFALAFLGRFIGENYKLYIITLFAALGVMTKFEGLLQLKYLSAFLMISGAQIMLNMAGIRAKGLWNITVPAFAALFSSLLYAFLFGIDSYLLVMAFVECAFVGALNILMRQGVNTFTDSKGESALDNEALISVAVILGAVVAGAADINIGPVPVKYVMCMYISLVASYKGGAPVGALCGVVLGFILTLIGYFNYSLIGVLSVAGVFGGILSKGGKAASAAGFAAGTLLSAMYLDTALLNLGFIYSFAAALAFYIVTPKSINLSLNTIAVKNAVNQANQAKELMRFKLLNLSKSFSKMGSVLFGLSDKKTGMNQKDISRLIDDAAEKACAACSDKDECWSKNFYTTYQMSFSLLEKYEADGSLIVSEIPEEYGDICAYVGYYASCLAKLYDVYKLNLSWRNQVAESKEILASQFAGIASILEAAAADMDKPVNIKEELEEKILTAFERSKIEADGLTVTEDEEKKYEVTLRRVNCGGRKSCIKEMAEIISQEIGRNMVPNNRVCENRAGSKCVLKFKQSARLKAVTGAAMAKKTSSRASGDSHNVVEVDDGLMVLAVSDGMGSGSKARQESGAAVDLLESLLKAGFSEEESVKMINSVLVLKSGDDSFSTMDICSVNLNTGMAEFIKIGAVSTFIKRGVNISQILSHSLPMGVLNEVEVRSTKKRLRDGDLIIMATDGVTDVKGEYYGKSWIAEALEVFEGSNPQDVADYLIKKAVKLSGDEIKDDMTVLCARVWEKIA